MVGRPGSNSDKGGASDGRVREAAVPGTSAPGSPECLLAQSASGQPGYHRHSARQVIARTPQSRIAPPAQKTVRPGPQCPDSLRYTAPPTPAQRPHPPGPSASSTSGFRNGQPRPSANPYPYRTG